MARQVVYEWVIAPLGDLIAERMPGGHHQLLARRRVIHALMAPCRAPWIWRTVCGLGRGPEIDRQAGDERKTQGTRGAKERRLER